MDTITSETSVFRVEDLGLMSTTNAARKKIDRRLVHKNNDENVLISDLIMEKVLIGDFSSHYSSILDFDPNHSFFFEHERHHVPGLLLIEAGRQNAMAITHMFLNIPLDQSFIMNEFNCSFTRFATIDIPVRIYTALEEKRSRSGRLNAVSLKTILMQNNKMIMNSSGSLVLLNELLMKRLELNSANS